VANENHKVFVSYHHANDPGIQASTFGTEPPIWPFSGRVRRYGDIDDDLEDDAIREIIRDEYLQDTTVTIVLVGTEAKYRKHIDWELYSSMYDGVVNKKSGVLVINLPTVGCTYYHGESRGR